MAVRVFCIRCRHFRMARIKGGGERYKCKKAEIMFVDSWLQRSRREETPQEKNAGNRCPDFARKNRNEDEEET